MKIRWIILVTIILTGMFNSANASDFAELKNKMNIARASLVDMMIHKEKRGAEQQKLVRDTTDAVSIQLSQMKAPPGRNAQFKELVDTWNDFKETREKELVPALLKGNEADASALAVGIQKQRMQKCTSLIKELEE